MKNAVAIVFKSSSNWIGFFMLGLEHIKKEREDVIKAGESPKVAWEIAAYKIMLFIGGLAEVGCHIGAVMLEQKNHYRDNAKIITKSIKF